jgi:Icc-related predicted phosphoesterase
MKILCFSDVHDNTKAIQNIIELSHAADVVVGAGDFCNAHFRLDWVIARLSQIEKDVVLVPGNNERFEDLKQACAPHDHMHVLHGSQVTVNGATFYGVGGGIPITPFGDWSYDFSESEAEKLLDECPNACVLITHSPPKNCLDRSSSGRSCGSTTIAKALDSKDISLNICGHIHASCNQQAQLGNTTVVNAGPKGMMINYET